MTHDDILDLGQDQDDSSDVAEDITEEKNLPANEAEETKNQSKDDKKDDKEKLILVKQTLEKLQKELDRAFKILQGADTSFARPSDLTREAKEVGKITQEDDAKIIEGIFDGQNMIGPDAKQYSIPANYASKSKLVEGDILKLTIQANGTFVYKQIGPKERARIKGVLVKDEETGNFQVLADGKKYKVILASVTYYKGEEGDEAAILVPQDKNSAWAAVENIIKKPRDFSNIKISPDVSEDVPKSEEDKVEDLGL